MGSKKVKTTSQETATTKPNTPAYATPAIENYFGQVGNLGQQIAANPSLFSTPANDTQMGAINAAGNLGGWQQGLSNASNLATQAAGTQLQPIGASYAGTTLAGLPEAPTAQTYNPATGQAGQAGFTTANAASVGPAQQASLFNTTAPTLGNAAQYTAPTLGTAQQATSQGYNPTTANAATVGQIERVNPSLATSASILDTPITNYLNPVTNELVNTSLANYDDTAARQQAAMAARAAGSGAFGGSRYGIAEAQLAADQTRNRALTEAELRSSAFDRATNLAALDTGNRQNTSLFNTTAQNNASSQNANAYNTGLLTQAGFNQQANLANADAQNQASAFGANAQNQASLFNTGQANQFGLAGAQLAADQGMFNAGQQNQFALNQAGFDQTASLANQAAGNQNAQFNASLAADNALANANFGQQANLFNAGAANENAAFNTGQANSILSQNLAAQNQAGQFNAGEANNLNSLIYGTQAQNANANADRMNQSSLFNAGVANNTSQFNSGLQQQQIANALAAAGLLGNNAISGGQLAQSDINTALNAGNTLYDIQQQQQLAPLTSLAALQGLIDPSLLQAISGQTINTSGTSTTKQSGGLLGSILGGLAQAGGSALMSSERRVKRDIKQIDTLPDGLGVYHYNYLWDEPEAEVRTGVMVDEVERLRPWALGPIIEGFRTVDYGAL